jgi:hypothetical protein
MVAAVDGETLTGVRVQEPDLIGHALLGRSRLPGNDTGLMEGPHRSSGILRSSVAATSFSRGSSPGSTHRSG